MDRRTFLGLLGLSSCIDQNEDCMRPSKMYGGLTNREPSLGSGSAGGSGGAAWPTSEQIGTLFDESFANLDQWTQVGLGTYTPSGSGLTISGGNTDYNRWIERNYPNTLENYVVEVTAECLTKGFFAAGFQNSLVLTGAKLNNRTQIASMANGATARPTLVAYNNSVSASVVSDAAPSNFSYSIGDILKIVFTRSVSTYDFSIYKNGVLQLSIPTLEEYPGTGVLPNGGGRFSMQNISGSWRVTEYKVTSTGYKNVRALFVGDSITHRLKAGDYTNRYANRVFNGSSKRFEVNAGSNDITSVYAEQTEHIPFMNAEYCFMMIGGNDIYYDVPDEDLQANYTAIRNIIVGYGGTPVHLYNTPRTTQDNRALNSWISSTFSNDIVIDTFTPLKSGTYALAAAYDSGDGVHPNAAGHQLIADTILAAMPTLP
jgi:lysophospholipase L1-like esterase